MNQNQCEISLLKNYFLYFLIFESSTEHLFTMKPNFVNMATVNLYTSFRNIYYVAKGIVAFKFYSSVQFISLATSL